MKNLNKLKLFTALLLLTALTTNAQITKGNWMVGGSGSFSSYESKDANGNVSNKGFGMRIAPNLGYFIADKFIIGAGIGFSFSNPEGGNNNSNGYSANTFVRYYFLKPENRINIFGEANFNYSRNYYEGVHTASYNGYGFKAGPAIFFNSSVALEITLDYNSSSYFPVDTSTSSTSSFKLFQIGLGFQRHLEK